MNVYIITALILIFYLALAWIAGTLLQLHGASLWILRGSLALVGIVAAGFFLWFHRRSKRSQNFLPGQAAGTDEISNLLHQAGQKLSKSKQGSLRTLPVIFVLGELNSAKTSIILHSGLEPELLAGHVQRDADVVPTSTINIWFARNTLLIEAGGKLASDPQLWKHLLYHTRPKRLAAALGKGEQAPRAVLACIDCEHLGSAQNSAQKLGSRLKEMAQSLGAAFPVYVLFTKLDRIPYFADFVGRLTATESAEILGATLPRVNIEGVFAEQESIRLGKVFDQLIYSLAEKRIDYLGRETAAEKIPGIYEFPRELRKIRNQVVQLLIDVSRPSQLSTNPFLRGFYFSGVRAVVVNEAVPMTAPVQKARASGGGATRMFQYGDTVGQAAESAPLRTVQSRKIPEWSFLPHLFTEIVLRDRVAFSSNRSTRVDKLRRVLLVCAAVVLLFFAGAFLVSFSNNRGLEHEVEAAATTLATGSQRTSDLPSGEQLQQLEQLRASLAKLVQYQADGPPTSHRFGLYAGDRIYPAGRSIYFQNFRRLLLAPTQARMISVLRQPPGTHSIDDFQQMYSTLKAYLITTSNHEHADWNSFVTVLLGYYPASKDADAETKDLIRRQFTFYAQELLAANPFGPENDREAVERSRAYLIPLDAIEPIYQAMLDDAGKSGRPVNFNRLYPGSSATVINNYEIPGAFTKSGFKAMQEAIRNPVRYYGGEEWVLGVKGVLPLPASELQAKLGERYAVDFVNYWRKFLKATTIVRYLDYPDGANKLQSIAGNVSPLLQLFLLVSQNTSVDSATIMNEFQPVQQLMAGATPERLIGPANQPYVGSLLALQATVAGLAVKTADPTATAPVNQAAMTARSTVGQVAQGFRIDNATHADVQKLLEAPIILAEALTGDQIIRALNAGGQGMCQQFKTLARKYPFDPKANDEATLQDLSFFQPGSGALWSFYEANLKNIVSQQGTQFVPNPTARVHVSAQFLGFLARAVALTGAFFPSGNASASPHLSYTIRQPVNRGITKLTLVLDGKTLSGSGGNSQYFTWPGEGAQGLHLTVNYSDGSLPVDYPGLWGVFHFFYSADRWTLKGGATEFEWPLELARIPVKQADGSPVIIRYEVDGAAGQLLRKNFLEGLHCPAVGAH
jgi:type VI secretion system protein ImpL